jgi:hypothetical protein
MNVMAKMIDKRRRIEDLWEKLRGEKIGTPEYEATVNEIGVLAMEYHRLTELGNQTIQTDALRRNKVT